MDQAFPTPSASPVTFAPAPLPWYHWRRLGLNFLTLSLLVHLFLGVGAAFLIVQTISSRKQTFAGQPAGPAAPTRALEHQVQMQKKQETMSAPAAVKRIVTNSANARVALPAMPPVFNADAAVVPLALSGMGGTGVGLGLGGGGGGGNGGGGGGMTFFGSRGGKGLAGTFYDFKQTRDRRPISNMDSHRYADLLSQFVLGGWNEGQLAPYFKGPQPIYAQWIFIPSIPSREGPAAFGLEKEVKPSLWVVLYKGVVSPIESGTYHFVGGGDDVLMVRFNGRLVLARNWDNPSLGAIKTNWRPQANYDYHYPPGSLHIPNGYAKGDGCEVTAGSSYPIEILIGEEAPPLCHMCLMIARDGDTYEQGPGGPLFPVFKLTRAALPPAKDGAVYPPHAEKDGPLWRTMSSPTEPVFP